MKRVAFLDLATSHNEIADQLQTAIAAVTNACQFASGPAVTEFEEAFAQYVGVEHCVGLNSGTSALHLALIATGIGPGDEVITTPMTWISSAWAITYVGATPVFVDIDPETYCISTQRIADAITPRTKAILPVHLYGQAADLDTIEQIAAEHGLVVVEDAAQAHGAKWKNRHVGTIGKAGCFSFYPSKNLGAFGEAGAVVTNDSELAHRIRALRDHAQTERHRHTEIGFNARMDGIQGAVLSVKLQHLDRWNRQRRTHADAYLAKLSDVATVVTPSLVAAQSHAWHLFVIQTEAARRDEIAAYLKSQGIGVGLHYPFAVPHQPAYAHLGYQAGDFPVAEDLGRRCLSLPMHPHLSIDDIDYVCRQLIASV